MNPATLLLFALSTTTANATFWRIGPVGGELAGPDSRFQIEYVVDEIRIRSTSPTALDFHFFEYSAGGGIGILEFSNGNTLRWRAGTLVDIPGAYHPQYIPPAPDGPYFDTIYGPGPSGGALTATWERANAGNRCGYLCQEFRDNQPTTLNFMMNGRVENSLRYGEIHYALQWDFLLGPGQTFLIQKTSRTGTIPEPSTIVMITAVMAVLGLKRLVR